MSQEISQTQLLRVAPLASAQDLLSAAVCSWEDTSTSNQYIQKALAQKDVDLDVVVSAYRYYFYKSNTSMALKMAVEVCDRIRVDKQWPADWQKLKPILLEQIERPQTRLFISAYAASGLLQARLGNVAVAQEIANQVQQLQAKEFGADVLLNILNPSSDEEA